ncbi:hypothetical protein [Spirulina sp. 06S082]|uniref:hypothetical protein n=1 Tax=Spirulina sp. 06S082 TaxID=3110248 RepID=UPI002B21F88C|nr:hypothetical protein [Spirulina sp. 06S082]MEA5469345.1 hypothetical protein [Spirulina sp. 06S082]
MLKLLLRDFREQWESENYTPYICWVITRTRYESRSNRWDRRHGRERLKQWVRCNRNNLSKEAFQTYLTTQKLNQ